MPQIQQKTQIFTKKSKQILIGWKKINPYKQKTISLKKVQQFLVYIFKHAKLDFQIELDHDTNLMEMIEAFKEEIQQKNKEKFNLQDSVNLLNWIVSGEFADRQFQQQTKVQIKAQTIKKVQQKVINQKLSHIPSEKLKEKPKQKTQAKLEQKVKQNKQQKNQKSQHFNISHKNVIQAWRFTNPKNEQAIQLKKVKQFLANFFQNSKQQYQFQIQDGLDFTQMINQFNEINQQPNRKMLTIKQSVNLLNWIVQEQENQSQEKQQQEIYNYKPQISPVKPQQQVNKPSQHKIVEPQNKSQSEFKLKQQKIKQQPKKKITPLKQQDIKVKQSKMVAQSQQQQQLDWGKVICQNQQQKNFRLYQQINSNKSNTHKLSHIQHKKPFSLSSYLQQLQSTQPIKESISNLNHISIKKQLAKIKVFKQKEKLIKRKEIPLVRKIRDEGKQVKEFKYFSKVRIFIKNKSPKITYQPQNALIQLFKFYCNVNSEYTNLKNKHKDPSKGTFEAIENKLNLLFMHNFMLFCKDFNIIQPAISSKQKTLQNKPQRSHTNKVQSTIQTEIKVHKRRNSKGLVPQCIRPNKQLDKISEQKQNKKQKNKKIDQVKKKEQILCFVWDRNSLCNLFKQKADYNLNIQYQDFVSILQNVLQKKIIVQQNKLQQMHNNDKQKPITLNGKSKLEKTQENQQVRQVNAKQASKNMAIQQNKNQITEFIYNYLGINTQPSYINTMRRLNIQYKKIQAQQQLIAPTPTPKTNKILNGKFKQNIDQQLKSRLIQRQTQQIEQKAKYLNKYSQLNTDNYSSFKVKTDGNLAKSTLINDQNRKGNSKTVFTAGAIVNLARNQIQSQQSQRLGYSRILSKNRNLPKKDSSQPTQQAKQSTFSPSLQSKLPVLSNLSSNIKPVNKVPLKLQKKTKHSDDIHRPLLKIIGCDDSDQLLDVYFDREIGVSNNKSSLAKSNVRRIR